VTDAVGQRGCPLAATRSAGRRSSCLPRAASLPGCFEPRGSALRLDAAIGNTVRFTGLAIEDVVPMASTRPAEYVGISTAGKVVAEWDAAACALRIERVTS